MHKNPSQEFSATRFASRSIACQVEEYPAPGELQICNSRSALVTQLHKCGDSRVTIIAVGRSLGRCEYEGVPSDLTIDSVFITAWGDLA